MFTLSEQEMLHIWERGLHQHPLERAITILAAVFPRVPRGTLSALSIGQRDAYLLAVQAHTFGAELAGFAACSRCQEKLEFRLDTGTIRLGVVPIEETDRSRQLVVGEYALQFRLPNSADLSAILHTRDVTLARGCLLDRCVSQATYQGAAVPADSLPEEVIASLSEQVLQSDPQAEVQLVLTCPACQYSWPVIFECASFLWTEIYAHVRRLLREVHTLALAYGWSEEEILAMSVLRRQFYLEMVS